MEAAKIAATGKAISTGSRDEAEEAIDGQGDKEEVKT